MAPVLRPKKLSFFISLSLCDKKDINVLTKNVFMISTSRLTLMRRKTLCWCSAQLSWQESRKRLFWTADLDDELSKSVRRHYRLCAYIMEQISTLETELKFSPNTKLPCEVAVLSVGIFGIPWVGFCTDSFKVLQSHNTQTHCRNVHDDTKQNHS